MTAKKKTKRVRRTSEGQALRRDTVLFAVLEELFAEVLVDMPRSRAGRIVKRLLSLDGCAVNDDETKRITARCVEGTLLGKVREPGQASIRARRDRVNEGRCSKVGK